MTRGADRSTTARLVAAIVIATVALAPGAAAAHRPSPHWVGTWGASPSDGSLFQPVLSHQTVRMIIAPHLAGTEVRIRLSNRFGTTPVTLGPATIGIRADGAAVRAGTLRRLAFAGASTVTIPPGAERVSDPVRLAVTPFGDLSVTVAVSGAVLAPTEHFVTRQTSYLTPAGSGDHAAETSGAAFTQTTTRSYSCGWYFLDGVDVRAAARTGTVVTFGDSITDGFQGTAAGGEQFATINADRRYPDDLQRRLLAARRPLSVLNAGISGNRLLRPGLVPMFGPSGLSRFGADALARPGVRDVIVLEGINDIGEDPTVTAAQVIAADEQLIAIAHRTGVRIQLGTITPSVGDPTLGYGTASTNAVRVQINTWIRRQRRSDGIVDFDRAVRDPRQPDRIAAAYDGGDHLHFSPAGYRAMARAVPLRLL